MRPATISHLAHYLPETVVTHQDRGATHPDWDLNRLSETVGFDSVHVAAADQFSSDLATLAARKLLADPNAPTPDYVICCTQTPDFPLPTTACIVQDQLGLPTSVGALDVRLGCSGYVYGLGLAKGLVASGQADHVLLLTTDVLTKVVNPDDKATAPIFGDAATASMVSVAEQPGIHDFVYGTDGTGAGHLLVPNGGLRDGSTINPDSSVEARGLTSQGFDLYMDGASVFSFTIKVVPPLVRDTLGKVGWTIDDVDLFVFHQANAFMINYLRKKLRIPEEKCWLQMAEVGNTGPSTIPLALSQAVEAGRLHAGDKVMIAGFGVGLSWAGATLTW